MTNSLPLLFPLADYWWFYGGFTLFVLAMLALDLGVFHRHAHVVGAKEAAVWTLVWIGLATLFGLGFWQYALWKLPQDPRLLGLDHVALAHQSALEFFTGFVVEKSLSVDNIFVFVVVFTYFGIPREHQHRVLFYGILGALVFRSLFIAAGAALMRYEWVVVVFGLFLLFTGVRIFFAPEKEAEPEKNPVIRLLRRLMPVTPRLQGMQFFVRPDAAEAAAPALAGRWHATPLFVALLFLELSDVLFAVDSVPAIFALTREPLIVFTSNIFAILGLRALFFLLAELVHTFRFLKYGLGVILIFVGLKMVWLNHAFGGKFPTAWSLAIIGGVLAGSVALSWLVPRPPAGGGAED